MSQAVGTTLEERVQAVRDSVRVAAELAGRPESDVTIVAVSKMATREAMTAAYDLGFRHFGENRVGEAKAKLADPLPSDCVLHMIGQLQSNKAGQAIDLFDVIESVDRSSLIDALEAKSQKRRLTVDVLLEVNIGGEAQKAGCAPEEAEPLARRLASCSSLRLGGLMTMAPLVDDPNDVRPVFRGLRDLRDRLQDAIGAPMPVLSMGMSNDYSVAIAEGATHVRIGRAIFG
jgi:pyridoxal phosphate enzyme (YggS family)